MLFRIVLLLTFSYLYILASRAQDDDSACVSGLISCCQDFLTDIDPSSLDLPDLISFLQDQTCLPLDLGDIECTGLNTCCEDIAETGLDICDTLPNFDPTSLLPDFPAKRGNVGLRFPPNPLIS